MKKTLALIALALTSQMVAAQADSETLYEGFNLSFGAAKHNTKVTTADASDSFKTTASMLKLNYTFGLAFPAKLGVTATMDLKNSKAGEGVVLASKTPSEFTIEPGILLKNDSFLYAKLGTYASRYESSDLGSGLSGKTTGIGIKHYIDGDNFVQFEWSTRKADTNNALEGKYKQSGPSLLVGHTF